MIRTASEPHGIGAVTTTHGTGTHGHTVLGATTVGIITAGTIIAGATHGIMEEHGVSTTLGTTEDGTADGTHTIHTMQGGTEA